MGCVMCASKPLSSMAQKLTIMIERNGNEMLRAGNIQWIWNEFSEKKNNSTWFECKNLCFDYGFWTCYLMIIYTSIYYGVIISTAKKHIPRGLRKSYIPMKCGLRKHLGFIFISVGRVHHSIT